MSQSIKLYEISDMMRAVLDGLQVVDEDGVVYDATNIDELNAMHEEKAEALALYIKEQEALRVALNNEISDLIRRKQSIAKRMDNLKDYLFVEMEKVGKTKVETPRVSVSIHWTKVVNVYDMLALPDKYVRQVIDNQPDKVKIREALNAGEDVPGADFFEHENLIIK